MAKAYYLYVIECVNGTLYVGYTTDIKRRYQEHTAGSPKCKYTRSFPPKRLAACWLIEGSLSDVLKCEHWLKKQTRCEKLRLIKSKEQLTVGEINAIIAPGVLMQENSDEYS